MKNKNTTFAPKIDFKNQTPEMLISISKPDKLYKKAFLCREDTTVNEFARNTTTWD